MAFGTRKRRGEGHERHLEILRAAQRVFTELGYDQTTMRRVAREVGMSPAGLYIYFSGKEVILAALRDQTFREIATLTRAAVATGGSPEERLRLQLRSYLDYACAHPDAYRLTFRSQLIRAPRPGRPAGPARAVGSEAFSILVSGIAELFTGDDTGSTEAIHGAAEAVWAAIHGLSSLTIDVPGFPVLGLDSVFDRLVEMVLAGFRPAAPPITTPTKRSTADHGFRKPAGHEHDATPPSRPSS